MSIGLIFLLVILYIERDKWQEFFGKLIEKIVYVLLVLLVGKK